MQRSIITVLASLLLANAVYAQADRPEFRAVWVTRFEWGSENPAEIKERITHAFEAIAAANFNAAVFQIRGDAEALYPSTIEPWSPLLGAKDPRFDPVAFAIEQARKHGIQFHAYINAMPMRSMRWREPPADKNHIWYTHGPESAEPWVCMDRDGRPAREDYYYMSAGVPGVQAYVRRVIMDVVRRYDIDGVHLDRIRYPGPEFIHDPISERRFIGRGNPNLKDRPDWQREQLDKFINDLAGEMWAAKPNLVFSCSAWGIYDRYRIPGYEDFSSGYHDYYQDTWNWVRIGAMDILMPMIYWDIPDPKPNYDELMRDFVQGVGGSHFVGGQSVFSPEENAAEIQATREAGGLGTVLFSLGSAERRGVLASLKETLYKEKAAVPQIERVKNPQTGGILGTVNTEAGKPLVDAWVSVSPVGKDAPKADVFSRTWTSSEDGRFAFLNVPPVPVKVTVRYPGAPTVESQPLEIRPGQIARVEMVVKDAELAQQQPFLQILRPADGFETAAEVVHLLGRTTPGCRATVANASVDVYFNGAFAKDGIPLAMGKNTIEVTSTDKAGHRQTAALTVTRKAPEPPEPAGPRDLRIVEPSADLAVMPGEAVTIKAVGPAGCVGYVTCFGNDAKLPLTEEKDDKGQPTGTYTAATRVPEGPFAKPAPVRVHLARGKDSISLDAASRATVEILDPVPVHIGEANDDYVGITAGLHEVRLGGPFIARVPRGTRFEIIGRQGRQVRIRLSRSRSGWVPEREVTRLPEGTPVPQNYFTACEVSGDDKYDRLSIGLRDKVVVAVRSETEPTNRLYVDFFNTHDALTWISHKSGASVIGTVTGEQIEDGWFRLTVPLKCKQIWGYWTELDDKGLTLFVRRPPKIADAPASPLQGLLIALEAGHGGAGTGARGHLGTNEKTINLAAVTELRRVLTERGAHAVLVRPRDSSPTLQARVDKANEADADLFVSIHANAAGNARGYLAVSGTSTYYKDKHCRLPAELVYRKLLGLNWGEFGVVGNFSYYPLQNTRMPAILIEQAFMSNPSDEARLLDPAYQKEQAKAVADALEQFLKGAREVRATYAPPHKYEEPTMRSGGARSRPAGTQPWRTRRRATTRPAQ
jgi:N-acetylmuramoyl-L-alanine amidase